MVAYSPEVWNSIRDMVIAGLAYKEIAAKTGINAQVIMTKACNEKWTAIKAQKRQEAQLESLRPHLHKHLHTLTGAVRVPKTHSAKALKEVADLVLTIANGTKLVEGWRDEEQNTLVNVLQISTSVTANPPKPVPEQPVIDVEASPELKQPILPDTEPQG